MKALFTTQAHRCRAWNLVILSTLLAAGAYGQIGDFGGPSILSRGGARPGQRGNTPMDFTIVGGISAVATTDPTGTNGGPDVAYGGSVNLSVIGSHSWAKSYFGVDYAGAYRHYNNFSIGNGIEQSLALEFDKRLSRRFVLNVRESASISKLALGGLSSYGFFTNDLIGVPVNNLFDAYAYSTQTSASIEWERSARSSLSFYGDAFQVHRTAAYLIGVRGYRAGANASYRISRFNDITLGYSFIHFSFPRAFGTSDMHGVQLGWKHRFNRSWTGNLGAGGYRVETLGTTTVTLPPEIAAILGRSSGISAVYRVSYAPSLTAQLAYAYQRSNFTLAGSTGVSPGNGVYLTSKTNTANIGYSYSGFRKASLSANFGYAEYNSLFQQIGKYSSFLGGVGAGYRIADYVNITVGFDIRQFEIQSGQKRVSETGSIGLSFAPYRVPIPSF